MFGDFKNEHLTICWLPYSVIDIYKTFHFSWIKNMGMIWIRLLKMVALEWQMAIEWIRSTDIEPAKKQVLAQIDTLLEFAQSLRDGYTLCLVANSLKTGCIKEISKVNNVNMHEVLMISLIIYIYIFFLFFSMSIVSDQILKCFPFHLFKYSRYKSVLSN